MFAGFSTYQNPKYATCIVAEHSTWGSVVAAPVGIEILKFTHDVFGE
jgi:cell division protein FtsI/penicillin-binding protein 2